MIFKISLKTIIFIFFLSVSFNGLAQTSVIGVQSNGSSKNNIITAVPFLLITPDARTSGMGNAGVATSGDVNASSINAAKLAFIPETYGVSLSYSPWLKSLIPDVSLSYLSAYYHVSERNTLGLSLRYFSLGEVQLTDINQQPLGVTNPNEFAVDFSFTRKFGEELAIGSSLRYIHSNLYSGFNSAGQSTKSGNAVSVDISALYKTKINLFDKNTTLSAGVAISNIGTKMSYSDAGNKYFLPINLKLGGAAEIAVDDFNDFVIALDFNKLLVPTQPIYDLNGNILKGKDPNRSVPAGIFGSFSDAPDGFSEELKEIGISTGFEYWYKKQFALRAGYNYENPQKGNNSYATLGAGVKYNAFTIDVSYLVAKINRNPLANTLRFTVLFNIAK